MDTQELDRIMAAARRGAASVTSRSQVVEDAADEVLHRLGADRTCRMRVRDLEGWAFRVAANAAKRIGRRPTPADAARLGERELPDAVSFAQDGTQMQESQVGSSTIDMLDSHRSQLTRKQLLVARKLAEPGMTLHRAAKELAMDRTSLRRIFHRALRGLVSAGSPPPPSFACGDRRRPRS